MPQDLQLAPLWLTLKVASWATVIAFVVGVGLALLFARVRFPGRDIADAVLTLPMVLPPTVLGYYLLVLLGRKSWFGHWLEQSLGVSLVFTWQGAVHKHDFSHGTIVIAQMANATGFHIKGGNF